MYAQISRQEIGRPGRAWRKGALVVAVPALVASGLAVLAGPAQAAGTTYQVAKSTTCSDIGGGTSAVPFCTITAAAKIATAGDTVRVAAGTYREQVTTPSGVTFVAQGAVTVLGTDSLAAATWTATPTNAWSTTLGGTLVPKQVYAGADVLPVAPAADQTTPRSWFFDTATRTLYVDLGGPAPQASDGLEVLLRSFGFLARNVTDVVINGFTTRRLGIHGVFLDGASTSTVRNVTVTEAWSATGSTWSAAATTW